QVRLAGEITRGLQNGDFEVHYQPIVDVGLRCVVGAEALLRWRHPERGLVLPGDFMQTAENSGLIIELGEFCMEAAHRQAAAWMSRGLQLRVAVNLSPRQLKDGRISATLARIHTRERRTSFPIDFELTEGSLFDTSDAVRRVLNDIKLNGYRIGL